MTFKEWSKKNDIDLSKYHGNVGDYEGNFWNNEGQYELIQF